MQVLARKSDIRPKAIFPRESLPANFQYPNWTGGWPRDRLRFDGDGFEERLRWVVAGSMHTRPVLGRDLGARGTSPRKGTPTSHVQVILGTMRRWLLRSGYDAKLQLCEIAPEIVLGLCWPCADDGRSRRHFGLGWRDDPKGTYRQSAALLRRSRGDSYGHISAIDGLTNSSSGAESRRR